MRIVIWLAATIINKALMLYIKEETPAFTVILFIISFFVCIAQDALSLFKPNK